MGWVKRHPLAAYFVLAFVAAWGVWGILGVAPTQGWIDIQVDPDWVIGIGAFGPAVAAFIVTGIIGGGSAIRELVGRLFRRRVGVRWVLIALFGPAALFALAAAFLRISGGVWPDISQNMAYPGLGWAGVWLLFLLFAMGEEPGWRGFALPRLQEHRSALSATLILWVFWVLWHLPVFWFFPGMMEMIEEIGIVGAIIWSLGILTMAILLTWLYNSSRGSILMVALVHGGLNTATMGGGDQIALLVSVFALVVAVIVLIVFRPADLSRSGKHAIATQ